MGNKQQTMTTTAKKKAAAYTHNIPRNKDPSTRPSKGILNTAFDTCGGCNVGGVMQSEDKTPQLNKEMWSL